VRAATLSTGGKSRDCREAGFTLIETMIALGLLLVVAAGVLPLGVIAITTTENQGHLLARTTEYAQDKLEQLMSLSYGDSTSDTRVFPATELGGSGLTVGGSADPDAPVELYVDYLDADGTLVESVGVTPPEGWYYKRVWSVAAPQLRLKQITVTVIVRTAFAGGIGRTARSTVAVLKTSPF
jgi:prepilin-type N-terminal cleavage/methylation domain-containing protein